MNMNNIYFTALTIFTMFDNAIIKYIRRKQNKIIWENE